MMNSQERTFYRFGVAIGENAKLVLFSTIILTTICSAGLYKFRIDNNIRDYAPYVTQSSYELDVAKEFFKIDGEPSRILLAIRAKDKGNLLREDCLDDAYNAVTYALNKLSSINNQTFQSLCNKRIGCNTNLPFVRLLELAISDNSTVTYPQIDIFGTPIYIGNNILKTTMDITNTYLTSAELMIVEFKITDSDAIFEWGDALMRWTWTSPYSTIDLYNGNSRFVTEEMQRGSTTALPYFGYGLIVLLIFILVTSWRAKPEERKPGMALAAVSIPFLGLAAAWGLISLTGYGFKSVNIMLLFLVFGMGVDDSFLMLHAWYKTDNRSPSSVRLGETLASAGPSITITSMTNLISISVGMLTQISAIRCFTVYGVSAVLIAYILQMTLYSVLLYYSGQREKRLAENLGWTCTDSPIISRLCSLIDMKCFFTWCRVQMPSVDCYVRFCGSSKALITLLVLLPSYWTISAYGIANSTIGLKTSQLLPDDSKLTPVRHVMENYVYPRANNALFIVNAAPDLRDEKHRRALENFVNQSILQNSNYRQKSLQWWLPEYMENTGDNFTYSNLPEWKAESYVRQSLWETLLPLNQSACEHNLPECVSEFVISFSFSGIASMQDRLIVVEQWRIDVMAEDLKEMNITLLQPEAVFIEPLKIIDSTLIRATTVSIICMTIICSLFIRHLAFIAIAVFNVLSIVCGMMGLLTLSGVSRDPILMIVLLVDIGLSVDFTSHVTYHYSKCMQTSTKVSKKLSKTRTASNGKPLLQLPVHNGDGDMEIEVVSSDRDTAPKYSAIHSSMVSTLLATGKPITQSAISSVIIVIFLAFKRPVMYSTTVFVKCALLINSLGMLHSFVVLPIMLTSYSKLVIWMWQWKRRGL